MVLPILVARIVAGGVAVLASLRYGAGLYAFFETEKLERPSYEVVAILDDGVEIRNYEPYLIAETAVDGVGFREPTSSGFRACAEYIFGKNKKAKSWSLSGLFQGSSSEEGEKMAKTAPVRVLGQGSDQSEKMAMTAPVRVLGGEKKTKVSFVIGKKYDKKTVPIPLNSNVKIREVPSHTLAVKTFSGPPPSDKRVAKERELIDNALNKAGMVAKSGSETLVYGYHDPFITPNFLRRNEVAVVIEGSA